MQEEILIQGEATKTIIKFFTTFTGQTTIDDTIYYVLTDLNNGPIKIVESKFEIDFKLNHLNYNIQNNNFNVYSGTVLVSERNEVLTQATREKISNDYINSIKNDFDKSLSGNSSNKPILFSTVFFEEQPYNDYYLNVKINRDIKTLDTLNIYNVPINESTKFENDTGVLFGKLEAIQVLLDDEGNNLRIPIKNAVIGIFNPSEEIPSIGSVDQNGNRICLSLYENLPYDIALNNLKDYASFQSYLTDANFSKNDFNNLTIPTKYKYTTLTNENGEFVLHNVPIGQQTLMVEVDLLKQGLNPEEVALNFFPYPTTEDPNVSNIPHFYFNQYPINIVPSWGDFQTGYTQANLSIVLDLRKWITYYTFPISYNEKVLERLYFEGSTNPFVVKFRDMTKPFIYNNPPKVEVVKIPDIYDRNLDLYNGWNNEFKIKNNIVEFGSTNFNAFKLPANLYDPEGIGTNNKKGVWIGAYQIKVSYPSDNFSFQATGFEGEWYTIDPDNFIENNACHYDLNRTFDKSTTVPNWDISKDFKETRGVGVGKFPYEKPWSLSYPENYKVTRKPNILNPYKSWNSNVPLTNVSGYNLTLGEFRLEPRYLDGDLVGGWNAWATDANGYGLQTYGEIFAGNNFSREVTQNEIWRYDAIDWWADEFSNGYNFTLTPSDFNKYPNSKYGKPYIEGERWQRLEAGYAYWLRPRGWPRIDSSNEWGDFLLKNDYAVFNASHQNNSVYNSYYSYFKGIYNYVDEVTMEMGNLAPWYSKFGRLVPYRIEKPYYLNPKKPPFVPQYIRLNFGNLIFDGTSPNGGENRDNGLCDWSVGTNNPHQFNRIVSIGMILKNLGTTEIEINAFGNLLKIAPKQIVVIGSDGSGPGITDNQSIILPSNYKYDPIKNIYREARYRISFINTTSSQINQATGPYIGNSMGESLFPYLEFKEFLFDEVGIEGEEKDYYLVSTTSYPVDVVNNDDVNSLMIFDLAKNDLLACGINSFNRNSLEPYFRPAFNGLAWEANHGGYGINSKKFLFMKSPLETYPTFNTFNIPFRIFSVYRQNGDEQKFNSNLSFL